MPREPRCASVFPAALAPQTLRWSKGWWGGCCPPHAALGPKALRCSKGACLPPRFLVQPVECASCECGSRSKTRKMPDNAVCVSSSCAFQMTAQPARQVPTCSTKGAKPREPRANVEWLSVWRPSLGTKAWPRHGHVLGILWQADGNDMATWAWRRAMALAQIEIEHCVPDHTKVSSCVHSNSSNHNRKPIGGWQMAARPRPSSTRPALMQGLPSDDSA